MNWDIAMPALPFFTFAAPVSSTSSPTPLVSPEASYNQGYSANLSMDSLPQGDLSGDISTNFWQQLQLANESLELPVGQELAALIPPEMTDVESQEPIDAMMVETSLQDESIAYFTPSLLATTQTQLTPNKTATQPNSYTPAGLQYIESLRNAQPHVQTVLPEHSADKSHGANSLRLGAEMVTTASSGVNPQDASSFQSLTSAQAATPQVGMVHTQGTTQMDLAKAAGVKSVETSKLTGVSLDGVAVQEMENNIHEKPITLTALKEPIVSSPAQANIETLSLNDSKAMTMDGAQPLLRDSTQPNKSLALDGNQLNPSTQANEKTHNAFNKLDVPPNHPQWNDQIAKRVVVMASESIQSARIQLDPPELGALEVKVKVQQDQVSVTFGSNQAAVRDALESQAPRLRELLEQQGVNLADVNVSDHSQSQGERANQEEVGEQNAQDGSIESAIDDNEIEVRIESDSLVDYFA